MPLFLCSDHTPPVIHPDMRSIERALDNARNDEADGFDPAAWFVIEGKAIGSPRPREGWEFSEAAKADANPPKGPPSTGEITDALRHVGAPVRLGDLAGQLGTTTEILGPIMRRLGKEKRVECAGKKWGLPILPDASKPGELPRAPTE